MKKTNETMLAARAAELYRESEYAVSVTDFFSPGERVALYRELTARIGAGVSRCVFWGGCLGAERTAAVFLPEWWMPDGFPPHEMPEDEGRAEAFASLLGSEPDLLREIPLACLTVRGSGFRALSHRDFMGGILSTGVDRSVIGDIAVLGDAEAAVFVHRRIAPYLTETLKRIGRDAVAVTETPRPPAFRIPRQFGKTEMILSSPRLDGVVKALTGKSREDAAELVRSGLVELSYVEETDVSAPVREGDVLSVRGYGKYRIGGVTGQTRSGRIRMTALKYL